MHRVVERVFGGKATNDVVLDERVEDGVGHEIGFIGLVGFERTQFSGRRLGKNVVECVERVEVFSPFEPFGYEGFGKIGKGGECAAGIAVHRGVANGSFAEIACHEEESVIGVRECPDDGASSAGLEVLEGDVVCFPGERPACVLFDDLTRGGGDIGNRDDVAGGADGLGEGESGFFRAFRG